MKQTNPKDALGIKRVPMSTVPSKVVMELGLAMLEGARKYGRHNYRIAGVRASVYYDACMRHMMAWWEGEDTDPDSGLSHITKAMASLTVLRDAMHNNKWEDDRPPSIPNGWVAELNKKVGEIIDKYPESLPPFVKDNWIYVSGKITDDTPELVKKNLAKFFTKSEELRGKGHKVFNPADHEDATKSSLTGATDGVWEHYIAIDCEFIVNSRPTLYMMKGWEKSRGARLEHALAKRLSLPITYEE